MHSKWPISHLIKRVNEGTSSQNASYKFERPRKGHFSLFPVLLLLKKRNTELEIVTFYLINNVGTAGYWLV